MMNLQKHIPAQATDISRSTKVIFTTSKQQLHELILKILCIHVHAHFLGRKKLLANKQTLC